MTRSLRTISKTTERRMVLGLQGLWPGWRWRGPRGVGAALEQVREVQVDPLDVVGRNQDLVFASRVLGYRRQDLDALLYRQHAAFEYGGAVAIYPRERLQLLASWVRHQGLPRRWEAWERANASVVRRVRAEIAARGPLESRAWAEGERTDDYRARRVEGLALYVLWRRLEVLVHHREGNRKFYDLAERVVGALPDPIPRDALLEEFAYERLRWLGLSGRYGIQYLRTQEAGRGRSKVARSEIRRALVDAGRLEEVSVEGERIPLVLRTEELPRLDEVESGGVPRDWRPLEATPEVRFLGPLDIVFTRGRALGLFGFEYLWEVYKPAAKRRWGYYVLPVLLDDRLVGRVDPSFDREGAVLRIERAWWEAGTELGTVAEPFARGIQRMADRLGARRIRLGAIGPPSFRRTVGQRLRRSHSAA
jgi:uncharacterized protein